MINEKTTLNEIMEHYENIKKISPDMKIVFDNGKPRHFLERFEE